MKRGAVLLVLIAALAPVPNAAARQRPNLKPAAELNEPGKKKVSAEAQKIASRAMAAFQKGDLASAKKDFQKCSRSRRRTSPRRSISV
jgi:hypothetical protein